MRKVRARVRFKGQVQGVGFRHFATQQAKGNGLTGWVRNLGNGDVEAVFEGQESVIRRALEACRQGPPAGKVTELFIDWEEFSGEFAAFEIRF
ncbi:acylphosphatase [Trichloromonas sp.]|uniref:acylphosphatase n=1 Tax=Trichloromonas sp. TaxID=3069249 RepID=UPI002A3D72B0|nr:acylphosphatase [Trichloromonas sp.]